MLPTRRSRSNFRMRANPACSGNMQILWNVNVDLLHDRHRLEWSRTVRERLEHQAFEQFAMSNVFAEQEWRGAPQNFIPT